MALSGGMFAQDYGQDRSRFQREGSWDHDRMVREYRGAFYDRLQSDLARAEQRGYLRGDDFRRFNVARREVGDFSAKWSRGIFDPREMDRAIGSVQRVADIRALRPDDRDALMDDLHRMREFRAHMEGRR
jgi:hypothetical protein